MRDLRLRSGREGNTTLPILAIIGAILALVGAWFLYQSTADSTKKMENSNTPINRNVAVNTNTVTNLNTAVNTNVAKNTNPATAAMKDWATYTNNDFNYSVQYPSTYSELGEGESVRLLMTMIGEDGSAGSVNIISSAGPSDGLSLSFTELDNLSFAWARGGFSATLPTGLSNKRTVRLGENTFTAVDVENADASQVNYYLVDGQTVYQIGDMRIAGGGSDNTNIIGTFTLTK